MMHSCSKRKMKIVWSVCLIFSLSKSILVFASLVGNLCRPDQRDALWEFKSEFNVQEGLNFNGRPVDKKTERWRNNTDCCSWDGVSCDPKTGNVAGLNLTKGGLYGSLRSNSSLFRLQHLQSLYLSRNIFSGILPYSIGNLKYLRVLTLNDCSFFGKIPSSIGNLSHLTYLSLISNGFTGEIPDSVGNLKRLTELMLLGNKLSGNFPPMLLNLSELTEIHISENQFKGMLPSDMSSLSKLEVFDISGNSFHGSVPSSLFMIPSLIWLDLANNSFSGSLAIENISSPSKFIVLSLGVNNFSGPIPGFISKLINLKSLDLSYWNTGSGMFDFSIFSHFKSLMFLDLSGINLKISSAFHLPSLIDTLLLSSCNISEFPKFLQTQNSLYLLEISDNQFEGQVPEWLWRLPKLQYANISHNSFSGFEGSSDALQNSALRMLDISSNKFQGSLPLLPNSMEYFMSSENWFSGEIPRRICKLVSLDTLILSNNNFSGSIPRCFNNTLRILHIRNNSLSGVFPEESIGDQLESLDVGQNQLSGELPKSLINCTNLEFLNVEDNKFSGKFPFWLRLLPNLQRLVLRSNDFYGPIYSPGDSFSFPKLLIFDISQNHFTGVFPADYFVGWSEMSSLIDIEYPSPFRFAGSYTVGYYQESVGLTNKGLKMDLVGIGFAMYKAIDVSGNRLQGDIPESIGLLKQLIVLNMSNNAFTGSIPPSMSNLTNLQSLDLSQNRLSGEIPPELEKLTFLGQMNFSHNRLEGPIPQGTQFQTQDSSSFEGNPRLCGAPLQETCVGGGGEEEEATKQEEDEEKDQPLSWVAAAIAYVPGVFCGLTIGHILTSYKHDWFMKIVYFFT